MDAATPRDLDHLDSEALKALVLALRERLYSHQKQLTTQQEEILSQREQLASRDAEIEHLKLLITKLRRQQFGRSSEKREYQIEQLELRLEELEAKRSKEAAAAKESAPPSTALVRPVRRPLPDHLPREVRKYLPKQEACPDCGGKLKDLGEDVSEILEYVPASLKVIQYVRPKLACGCCDRIVQAEAPSRPIERSIAGPGLLAHVLVSKYCDHLPLYRQSQIFARTGPFGIRGPAHMHAFEYFGGVPRLLVPDNPRTGVSRACRYAPDLNPTYQEFAMHYGVGVVPARPYRPRDKAKVVGTPQCLRVDSTSYLRTRPIR